MDVFAALEGLSFNLINCKSKQLPIVPKQGGFCQGFVGVNRIAEEKTKFVLVSLSYLFFYSIVTVNYTKGNCKGKSAVEPSIKKFWNRP